MTKYIKTGNLRPFLEGVGSVLDIMPADSDYQEFLIEERPSDAENLAKDWQKVGADMKKALRQVASEEEH